MDNKVVVIVGPTGSGKTKKAIKLAGAGGCEIVNGDSMQVYRELSIGNNKGDLSEFGEIPIWLFDIISVTQNFTVVDFQERAREVISQIHDRGNTPVIVGGSGYYISAAVYDYNFPEQKDVDLPEDVDALQKTLRELDFDLDQLNNSDRNNPRRLQNYIRKALAGDITLSGEKKSPLYNLDIQVIDIDLEDLRISLEGRVDEMVEQGLIAEVEALITLDRITPVSDQVKNASGYKQVFEHLQSDKQISLEELKQQIVTSHYQLAKKQITWNKKHFPY